MNYDRLLQLGGIDREVPPIPGYITKEHLQGEIDVISAVIPEEASDTNQLADKNYVNEKVSTDSATFRQTWNLVSDLGLTTAATHSEIGAALATAITTADNNDYSHVQIPTADATPTKIAHTERYKFNGTTWGYEFDVADPSSVPTSLSQLSDDSTHRLVTDTEKETWNGKAEVGTVQDEKTADTIFGAKAYANDAVDAGALVQQNIAAILALSQGTGTTTLTTNPEWKLVLVDDDDKILLAKGRDNTWYTPMGFDELLDFVIADYGVNNN